MSKYFCLIIICFLKISFAQIDNISENNREVDTIYENYHSFILKAPVGWTMTNGIDICFLLNGANFQNSKAFINFETVNKRIEGNETIDKLFEKEGLLFKSNVKNYKIQDADSVQTSDNKFVKIKYYFVEDDNFNYYAANGYLNEKKIIISFQLSARNMFDFENSLNSYKELINSYYLLSDAVKMDISEGYYLPRMINFEHYKNFEFYDENCFKYIKHENFYYDSIGFGKYVIKDDNLILNFDTIYGSNIKDLSDTINIVKAYESKSDTLIYTGKILDIENNKPIPDAIIKANSFGCESDSVGNYKIKFLKAQLPISLDVFYLGYDNIHFFISDSLNKNIVFKLKAVFANNLIHGGTIYVYKISNINNRFIEIRKTDDTNCITYIKQNYKEHQNKTDLNKIYKIYELDKLPILNYDGGLKKYIFSNLRWTDNFDGEGTVLVSFIIQKNGKIKDVKIERSLFDDCDEEAIRVISSMPNWKPGIVDSKAVNVKLFVPVKFKIKK